MEIPPGAEWVVELDEVESRFGTTDEIRTYLTRIATLPSGCLWLERDLGLLPWWQRFLGWGTRDARSCFSVEWNGEHAALIFYDEAVSEYRALDPEYPTTASAEIRLSISQGDPMPADECIKTDRAFQAIYHFLKHGSRPDWLSYRYVR